MSETRSGTKHIALSNSILIEPYLIIGFVGVAFNFAWVFLFYGTNVFAPIGPYTQFQSMNTRLVLMVSVSLAYIVGWALSDFLFDKRMVLAFLVVVLGTANCWPVVFPGIMDSAISMYIFWVMTGIGYASSFLLWSEYLSTLNVYRSKIFIAGALLLGAVFAWPISLMTQPVSLFVSLILPVLSCCALLFLDRSYAPLVSRVHVTKQDSDKRQTLTFRPIIATWASSIAFGFVLFYICSHAIESPYVTSVLAFAFALACTAILVDSLKHKVINEDLLLKIFLPTAAIGFFSLLLFGPVLRLICIGLMVVGLTFQMAIGLSAISGHVNLFRLSPFRVFGYGRAATAFGLALGWLLGGFAREGAIFGDAAIVVVSVVLMTVFIFISSFVMENHYPFKESRTEGAENDVEASLRAKGGSSDASAGSEGEIERGIWRKRCEAVAALYDLSPRQREVLILLAKGRNAEYIQEKLVVSNHTAKAHIYNIYQKTNVHSRQELIDLIEAIDLTSGTDN